MPATPKKVDAAPVETTMTQVELYTAPPPPPPSASGPPAFLVSAPRTPALSPAVLSTNHVVQVAPPVPQHQVWDGLEPHQFVARTGAGRSVINLCMEYSYYIFYFDFFHSRLSQRHPLRIVIGLEGEAGGWPMPYA